MPTEPTFDPIFFTVLVSAFVSLAISATSSWVAVWLQKDRLRTELKLEFAAETAIRELLSVKKWKLRSFQAIKDRIGGIEGDELRKLLVRSGALRFGGKNDQELWGLRERNQAKLVAAGETDQP